MVRLTGILGIIIIFIIAYLLSSNKKAINKKTILWGFILQVLFAFVVLKGQFVSVYLNKVMPVSSTVCAIVLILEFLAIYFLVKIPSVDKVLKPKYVLWFLGVQTAIVALMLNLVERFFMTARGVVDKIISYATEGAYFVFGPLGKMSQPKTIHVLDVTNNVHKYVNLDIHAAGEFGLVFAFQVLPTIIFVASIFAILYYFGVMQIIVKSFAKFMIKFLAISGAESTSVAASIFMGQTEAPLTIRPYLNDMTMSELMTIMTAGMAHVSGGIMAAYVMIADVDIKHLLTAVIMTAPGAIMLAKLMMPETEKPKTGQDVKVDVPVTDVNVIDAAARGAAEGGGLALNVTAMLVAFIALIALCNGLLASIHTGVVALASKAQNIGFLSVFASYFPSSIQQVLGWIFAPLAWTMGVPWQDASTIGSLMGTRLVLNEFVAFLQLGPMQPNLDPRSFVIATYALCGFANFSSIAIQVGGIGALAPSRRHDLARLGIKAMIAGTLANFLTACIVGIIL